MKHKHYDMIVAKAANVDLVQMIKVGDKWGVVGSHDNKTVNFGDHYDYFLCLPQHKEACLHWLNGGDVQVRDFVTSPFSDVVEWSKEWAADGCGFMVEDWIIRIKPKKEKRWIATFPWSGNAFYVTPESFASEELLNDYVDMHYGKRDLMLIHEIEVEV